jgi:hypothetical protein
VIRQYFENQVIGVELEKFNLDAGGFTLRTKAGDITVKWTDGQIVTVHLPDFKPVDIPKPSAKAG